MRRVLDLLYTCSLWGSAVLIVAILALIVLQMAGRITGHVLAGTDDFAGYAVVGSAYLGLAATLRAQGHIRVQLLLQHLPARAAAWCEVLCGIVGTAMVGFLAYASFDFVRDSYQFHEVAGRLLSTPLWIPQSLLVFGLLLMLMAMMEFCFDALVAACGGARPSHSGAPTLPATQGE